MYIGIDLGGTNIAAGLIDDAGQVLAKHAVPTYAHRTPEAIVEDMVALIQHLASVAEQGDRIDAVGIGIPGIFDPVTGRVLACVNLNWYDYPLRDVLSRYIQLPVFVSNDATVAAVAEFEVAQRGRYDNAVLLTLGTGIGSGIIVNGQVINGVHGIASEVGHMKVGEGLYTCACGGEGCLETFCSSKGIIHYARHLLEMTDLPSVLRTTAVETLDGAQIFEAAKVDDVLATKVVDRMVKYLGIGIMNIIATIDPEVILLGGGLSMAGEFLLERVREQVEKLKFFKAAKHATIDVAKLQNDAGIIGAGLLAKLELHRIGGIYGA
ncbi:ROK family protein [Fusibacter sp. JL298sf-3]